jgi:hypothetical protein
VRDHFLASAIAARIKTVRETKPTTMPGVTPWKGKRKPVTPVPAAMIRNMLFTRIVLRPAKKAEIRNSPDARHIRLRMT